MDMEISFLVQTCVSNKRERGKPLRPILPPQGSHYLVQKSLFPISKHSVAMVTNPECQGVKLAKGFTVQPSVK